MTEAITDNPWLTCYEPRAMKMVLALQHETLPKTLHVTEPSSHIEWEGSGLELLTESRAWPRSERVRRAGVSSFGVSGTNAHVVLEEAPATEEKRPEASGTRFWWPALVSGRTGEALQAQAATLRAYVESHSELELRDVCHTLATARTHFEHRGVVVARDVDEAIAGLQQIRDHGDPSETPACQVAVLFTGQGSQYAGMGRELYERYGVFRRAVDEIFAGFAPHLPRPLDEVMFAGNGSDNADDLHATAWTQPALFALEVGLYGLWQSWGLCPDYLLGHSIGELSAAHVAGMMSLEDACRLVAARAQLMQSMRSDGAMVAVQASEQEVGPHLQAGRVELAAVNGPQAVVISGDAESVEEVAAHFVAEGRRTRRLRVSHAFHSPHMDGMLEAYGRVAEGLTYHEPSIPVVSNVTGEVLEEISAAYWVRQVRESVRFLTCMQTLEALGARDFVELGPQA